jgi:hypothetical protein
VDARPYIVVVRVCGVAWGELGGGGGASVMAPWRGPRELLDVGC